MLRTIPDTVVGPGHNSVVTTPEGLDVMAYHAWDPAQTRRRLCIDPIVWPDGRPVVLGPTSEPVSLSPADRTRHGRPTTASAGSAAVRSPALRG